MQLNGLLMHKDTVVADIKNNELEIINQGLLPLYLKRNGSLETWIASRAIDAHRPHSRLIKRILRLSAADDCEVALKVNAATITDNWWIKQTAEESLKYKDVRFSVNYFDNLALKGDPDSIERINHPEILTSRSPELTNIGSFEKCWKLENQEWWLYKLSNAFQTFSELFIFEMGSMLGFDMAYFEPWESGTKTLDFTENAKYDFEPAFSLVGEEVDYFTNYPAFHALSPELAQEYLDILACDALFFNFDRHTHNYGFLRDSDTGLYLKMAPNFDNNLALIANGYPSQVSIKRKNDLFINDFLDLLDQTNSTYYLPELSESMIDEAFELVGMNVHYDTIKAFILNGYDRLAKELPTKAAEEEPER
ncbi:hypothetical protein [Eubacterium callanderi]|uniref:hypothetical protein n=1 Tax=Eubacterium callanderi TaxID=53442 RepID=UPI002943DA1E|nr:hypothetical protein [Eubacterium callanderi]